MPATMKGRRKKRIAQTITAEASDSPNCILLRKNNVNGAMSWCQTLPPINPPKAAQGSPIILHVINAAVPSPATRRTTKHNKPIFANIAQTLSNNHNNVAIIIIL